jgi:hypothetical protein
VRYGRAGDDAFKAHQTDTLTPFADHFVRHCSRSIPWANKRGGVTPRDAGQSPLMVRP